MGFELEVEAAAATAALDPPHVYVPWVTVNGIAIGEGYQYLLTFVCAAYAGDRRADLGSRCRAQSRSMSTLRAGLGKLLCPLCMAMSVLEACCLRCSPSRPDESCPVW